MNVKLEHYSGSCNDLPIRADYKHYNTNMVSDMFDWSS